MEWGIFSLVKLAHVDEASMFLADLTNLLCPMYKLFYSCCKQQILRAFTQPGEIMK